MYSLSFLLITRAVCGEERTQDSTPAFPPAPELPCAGFEKAFLGILTPSPYRPPQPRPVGDRVSGLSPGPLRGGVGFAPGDCESGRGGWPQWEALFSLYLTSGLGVAPFLLSSLSFPSNQGLSISHLPPGPRLREQTTRGPSSAHPLSGPARVCGAQGEYCWRSWLTPGLSPHSLAPPLPGNLASEVPRGPALPFSPSNTQTSSSVGPRDDRAGAEVWAGPGVHLGREFGVLGSQRVV